MAGGFSFSMGGSLKNVTSEIYEASHDSGIKHGTNSEDVIYLRGEVERLLMITEALWTIIQEEHGYSEEELIKRIAQIDIRDGKLDGKVATQPKEISECPDCGRPVGRKRTCCLYCGTPLVRKPFER
jgi:hypothetical protein